jgi:pyruvate dehydrogenase E1 component
MVHHANTVRPNADGTKVGGHQASSASLVSVLTALYCGGVLGEDDLVALKAHASPAFYALQYLRGRLEADDLRALRSFGGLQAYPSRRKNPEIVDLSTGSMGLGAVEATFTALTGRYVGDHFGAASPAHVWVMVGDAELDEGNVWEALLEEAVPCVANVTWIVDLNRQSLDRITPDARPAPDRVGLRGARVGRDRAAMGRAPRAARGAARAPRSAPARRVSPPAAPARGRSAQGAGDGGRRRGRPRARRVAGRHRG